jgi:glycosyltransferase involved in cell wall biosynthesis
MSRHILILVENLSVPFDRRVWQESCALVDAGFRVTVICPAGPNRDQERQTVIDGVLYWLTRGVERLTFAAADAVISTNESYRQVAVERGKMPADRVVVVRSAPDLSRFVRRPPDNSLRSGKDYLLAYLGVMGPQDGVDYALRALKRLRDDLGRKDVYCVFMGAGDAYDDMVSLSKQLGVDDFVNFPGRVSDEFVQRCLSTADVCLSPDPRNPLNNVSTMNKVLEYMAMARPIVSFDLLEARISAGDAAVYVPANDEMAFAEAIDGLLDDAERRHEMGQRGRSRLEEKLSWEMSRHQLVKFYEHLFAARR